LSRWAWVPLGAGDGLQALQDGQRALAEDGLGGGRLPLRDWRRL
jgi:hypothetical protein